MQVCAGQDAGSETALRTLGDLYQQGEIEAVLLADTDNAFSSFNRKAMLQKISITCPIITLFISNCYMESARSFVLRHIEITSKGQYKTIQGDPAKGTYTQRNTPLLHFLR